MTSCEENEVTDKDKAMTPVIAIDSSAVDEPEDNGFSQEPLADSGHFSLLLESERENNEGQRNVDDVSKLRIN